MDMVLYVLIGLLTIALLVLAMHNNLLQKDNNKMSERMVHCTKSLDNLEEILDNIRNHSYNCILNKLDNNGLLLITW